MLDTDTKPRIDTARDILVGKVPDPKSQVEQITIALIYKFMDDMDADSEELGGQETLNLYAEVIAKMPENPGIPALFLDIFRNAYLPYRDPETLRAYPRSGLERGRAGRGGVVSHGSSPRAGQLPPRSFKSPKEIG